MTAILSRLLAAVESAIEDVINAVVDRIIDAWVEDTPAKGVIRHAERPAVIRPFAWDHVGAQQKVGPGGAANAILPALAPEASRRIP